MLNLRDQDKSSDSLPSPFMRRFALNPAAGNRRSIEPLNPTPGFQIECEAPAPCRFRLSGNPPQLSQ